MDLSERRKLINDTVNKLLSRDNPTGAGLSTSDAGVLRYLVKHNELEHQYTRRN